MIENSSDNNNVIRIPKYYLKCIILKIINVMSRWWTIYTEEEVNYIVFEQNENYERQFVI